MPVRKSHVLFAALALWLAGSTALKVSRYSDSPAPRQERTERAMDAFMSGHGWRKAGSRPITSDGNYVARVYALPGCATPVTAAPLGRGNESVEAVLGVLGRDVAFLESGSLAPEPQQRRLAVRALVASGLQRIGGPRDSVPSIVAIAPAPRDGAGRCGGPTPADWAAFDRLGD